MGTATTFSRHGVSLPGDRIAEFCRRWRIRELAVFGSVLRDDFKVSKETRAAHPEIPRAAMYGMRNVLVHAYGSVDLARVWVAAGAGVPALIRALEPLIPPDDGIEPPTKLTPRGNP